MADKPRTSGHTIDIELRKVNPHIVCRLCAGYYINAATIMECLHTFCKSCIVMYFESNRTCPTCGVLVHETNPIEMLRLDRTMQAIVYKIVHGLKEDEEKREIEFYRGAGLPLPEGLDRKVSASVAEEEVAAPAKRPKQATADANDSYISFVLERDDGVALGEVNDLVMPLDKPYIRTSMRATILHVKKFVAKKLSLNRPEDVDVLCNREVLGKEYTLEYIFKTRWRKEEQLCLKYRPRIDFEAP